MPTPFPERLKELVRQKGTSISRLYDDATWHGEGHKPSKAQLDKAMRGLLPLRVDTMEMLAAALGEPPEVFDEYRLAMARRMLDERQVPLDEAMRNLELLDAATRSAARGRSRRAASPRGASPAPTPEGQPARRKTPGA